MELINLLRDTLAGLRKKALHLRKLQEQHPKLSLESEPYKIKYEAMNTLKEMITELENVMENIAEEEKRDELVLLAKVHLKIGLLHADTEELKAGEEQFMKCLEILKNRKTQPEAVLPVLSALNQLGIIWSQWGQPSKAKVFLDEAEEIYKEFTNSSNPDIDRLESVTIAKHFGLEEDENELSPNVVLEKLHTLTLYYLAQVYGILKDHHKSAVYCHMTLRRQLGDEIAPDCDYVDWALNAATLSQYFMENDGFTQARHHLAAASYVLHKHEEILRKKSEENGESEQLSAEWENFKHRSADVARCWAKYGILLLSLSKERLFEKIEAEENHDRSEPKEVSNKSNSFDELKFDVLEVELEPIMNQITDKYLLDFNDARPVFLNAQKWLEQANAYYTLDNHASDYVLIAQDMSQAYKYLSFFEEHEDRQAKMHKRRIDILENVIKELNPQYYKSACRQIWIELGETYTSILDIKLDRLRETDDKLTAHALIKINHLAKSAIKNYQSFLDSLDTRVSNAGVEQFPEDVLQPALFAHFFLGRLYYKIITPDKVMQLENTENSIKEFRFVVDYCEKYPNAAEIMKDELSVSKELAALLPLKVVRLRQAMMNQ